MAEIEDLKNEKITEEQSKSKLTALQVYEFMVILKKFNKANTQID